jgi:hypothetical protein
MSAPLPKPESRRRIKARLRRMETDVVHAVRPQCVDRDGYCRLNVVEGEAYELVTRLFGECQGYSEWAHLGDHRRARTRGQDPEVRHTTAGSLMFCAGHHHRYDANDFTIEETTARGANGPLRFVTPDGESYTEVV